MTREELAKLPLRYVFGSHGEREAVRIHATEDGRIKRILRTPKHSHGWGTSVVTFAIEGSDKEYKTVAELLDALNSDEAAKGGAA